MLSNGIGMLHALIFRVKKSTVKLISKCIVAFILFCGSVCLFPETLYWFFRNFTGSSLSLLQHCPGHSYEDNASCKETSFGKIGQWPVQFAAFSISICICICVYTCICICISQIWSHYLNHILQQSSCWHRKSGPTTFIKRTKTNLCFVLMLQIKILKCSILKKLL